MQQPSATCWPLSGGGSGSPSRSGKRLDGAAERRPRLQHSDLVPRLDEVERSREARQAPADHGSLSTRFKTKP